MSISTGKGRSSRCMVMAMIQRSSWRLLLVGRIDLKAMASERGNSGNAPAVRHYGWGFQPGGESTRIDGAS